MLLASTAKQHTKKRDAVVSHSTAPYYARPSFAVAGQLFSRPINFVIDTGADVSLLPARFKHKTFPFSLQLKAANGTPITSHGCLFADISLSNLRRSFKVQFIVADVVSPILGADFFKAHGLLIDVSSRMLIDKEVNMSASLGHSSTPTQQISLVSSINESLFAVLQSNNAVFDIAAKRPQPNIVCSIETTSVPKPCRPYRLSPEKLKAAKAEIDKELSLGRMTRSSSQYASPFFPVKKTDGSWRFVADYTRLNNVTIKDNYIPPRIDDLLARIPSDCIFSKLDLQKAFFQIPLDANSRKKTAVITPFGLYEYAVMPMGLKNASQVFQRYIDSVLSSSTNTIAYCDDILLFTSEAEHMKELDKLLQTLFKAGLVVNQKKSKFYLNEVEFLGHKLTSSGFFPLPDKVDIIRQFQKPTNIKQLRRFLGLVNFYRKFVPQIADHQKPLTSLLQKDVAFKWTAESSNAFNTLIDDLSNATRLIYPSADDQYVLCTDASSTAIGSALSCKRGPVGFFSRSLSPAEQNLSVYDKELLAVFTSVKHFEWLLFGREFTLKVDHKPLTFLFSKPGTSERRRRIVDYLSTFHMSIKYIPGKENVVADALSRDKHVDAISLNQSFLSGSAAEILSQQNNDSAINKIPTSLRSLSTGVWRDSKSRVLVPQSEAENIIRSTHSVSHSGFKSTLRQIQSTYVWPKMRKQIRNFIRVCMDCQSSKITRHTKPPFKSLGVFPKFSAIHIDFVGPLPPNQGKTYLLTMFDRTTRWFEAYPTSTATANLAVDALMQWIATHGVPDIIISDQGRHFEAELFKKTAAQLGIEKRRTTAYHPSANGAVERQHRHLKEALKAKSQTSTKTWLRDLPLVLLGLRNGISDDTGRSAAQSVFGRQLSVPNCIFEGEYNLDNIIQPQRKPNRPDSYLPPGLRSCKYVWLKKATSPSSLSRPYQGPYEVIKRDFNNHTVVISITGTTQVVSMERVKPCWTDGNLPNVSTACLHSKCVTFADLH